MTDSANAPTGDIRAAVMPAPAMPASVQAVMAFDGAPRMEAAVSGAERGLSFGRP